MIATPLSPGILDRNDRKSPKHSAEALIPTTDQSRNRPLFRVLGLAISAGSCLQR